MNVHRDLCTFFFVRIKQLEDNKKNSEKLFNNLPIARYHVCKPYTSARTERVEIGAEAHWKNVLYRAVFTTAR